MTTGPLPPKEGIDFEDLPWNLNLPEEHYYVHVTTTSEWTKDHYDLETDTGLVLNTNSLKKYSDCPLPLHPSATSLNYGTTIWEGLKCYRDQHGKPVVFRPDRNYARFCKGAHAMCLPQPSKELFLKGIQAVLHANSHLIPPKGDGE